MKKELHRRDDRHKTGAEHRLQRDKIRCWQPEVRQKAWIFQHLEVPEDPHSHRMMKPHHSGVKHIHLAVAKMDNLFAHRDKSRAASEELLV